jgi:hypothetical protein
VKQFFDESTAELLIEWLEKTNQYVSATGDFYQQSMFPLSPNNISKELTGLFAPSTRGYIRSCAENAFETQFHDNFIVTAHRHLQGQGTLIHNDYHPDPHTLKYGFTHRIIVYLNRVNTVDGGILGVYRSTNTEDLVTSIYPIHNTAVGLEFGPTSYHDVSPITKGERYTLNFTLLSRKD